MMEPTKEKSRRSFLKVLGSATGAIALAPVLSACAREASGEPTTPTGGEPEPQVEAPTAGPVDLPLARPDGWDPIAFNRDRGNAGAVPESYRGAINAEDSEHAAIGKHLPYIPVVTGVEVPEGFLPVMFGDAAQGHAQHPASPNDEGGGGGHWFDWVRLRKGVEGEAEELEVRFSSWPEAGEGDRGRYAVQGGGAITDEVGKNTIYLLPLPPDLSPGDSVRVVGHCTLHGEYVEFLTVPAA